MENVFNVADNKSADTVETTPTAQQPLARKSVSLTAGTGSTFMRMVILAKRTRSGAETSVMTTDKSKTVRRGMTSTHNTFDAAVAALQKLVSEAVQKGWKKSERVGGFKRRPDAFTSMPTAPKSGAK